MKLLIKKLHRIYAEEFVFDLADKEITMLAIERAAVPAQTSTEKERRRMWLRGARNGWTYLSETEQAKLKLELEKVKKESLEDNSDADREILQTLTDSYKI